MDTFIDSSWYFFRYADPRNETAPYASEPVNYWFPIDVYIGGVEHAVLHLIYMRFFTKVMRDLGLFHLDEPVDQLFTQGMVLKDGSKMSKSRGNTVAPDLILENYGADVLRLFIQFCAPPDGELDWNDQGLEGCSRFINRFWRIIQRFKETIGPSRGVAGETLNSAGRNLLRKLHQTIRKVGEDITRIHQNTAISAIMELMNQVYDYVEKEEPDLPLMSEVLEKTIIILSPFSPHIAEEAWGLTGHEGFVSSARWPDFDAELAREEEIEVVIQINGRIRSRFYTSPGASKEELEQAAIVDPKISSLIEGKKIRRAIVVPGRLVNLVVE
jgi:leucyl-tRNA synthetase